MSRRDRIVLMVIVTLAVLGGAWMLVVSPERKQAGTLATQLTSAEAQLASAEGQLADARGAQSRYADAYAAVVNLGKAVPPNQEVPSLIYQLSQATHQKNVEFASIASSSAAAASASTPIAAAAGASGFSQMPFTFVFNGSFFDLEHLFGQLNGFATQTASGALQVRGRLLTIQSLKLEPLTSSAPTGKETSSKAPQLTGTITATAYQLAASEAAAGQASPGSPTGAASTPTSSTGAASSPTAPAIARVTP
jgi:Tfp pilus assembly protein PilO